MTAPVPVGARGRSGARPADRYALRRGVSAAARWVESRRPRTTSPDRGQSPILSGRSVRSAAGRRAAGPRPPSIWTGFGRYRVVDGTPRRSSRTAAVESGTRGGRAAARARGPDCWWSWSGWRYGSTLLAVAGAGRRRAGRGRPQPATPQPGSPPPRNRSPSYRSTAVRSPWPFVPSTDTDPASEVGQVGQAFDHAEQRRGGVGRPPGERDQVRHSSPMPRTSCVTRWPRMAVS